MKNKYNIGDMFVDMADDGNAPPLISYIFNIEYNTDPAKTYYWLRYLEEGYRDTYWTFEEIEDFITNNGVQHIPVKKNKK